MKIMFFAFIALFSSVCFSQQTYPTRPLRIVVTFPPGGTQDIVGRFVAQKLTESLNSQVIVDNRGGAGGSIGAELVAKATPDGYTLLLGSTGTLAINPALYAKRPYNPIADFAPISLVAMADAVIVANPSLPARSLAELISVAKARPGKLNYATSGPGTTTHLFMEMFIAVSGVNFVHIPYKGTGPALVDLLGGEAVSLMAPSLPGVISHIKSGKLRALAVMSTKRSSLFPEVPTVAESGFRGFDVSDWFGLLAPAGAPNAVLAQLQTRVSQVVMAPDSKKYLAGLALEPVVSTPEQFAVRIKDDLAKFSKVIAATGVQIN